jgi:hypothetical protein
MLASFHKSASVVISDSACPWQKGNLEPGVRRDSLYKWRRKLGPARTWLIQRYVRRHAMMLGYFEEKSYGNAMLLIFVIAVDQCMRILAASRIEPAVRSLFARKRP